MKLAPRNLTTQPALSFQAIALSAALMALPVWTDEASPTGPWKNVSKE